MTPFMNLLRIPTSVLSKAAAAVVTLLMAYVLSIGPFYWLFLGDSGKSWDNLHRFCRIKRIYKPLEWIGGNTSVGPALEWYKYCLAESPFDLSEEALQSAREKGCCGTPQ